MYNYNRFNAIDEQKVNRKEIKIITEMLFTNSQHPWKANMSLLITYSYNKQYKKTFKVYLMTIMA